MKAKNQPQHYSASFYDYAVASVKKEHNISLSYLQENSGVIKKAFSKKEQSSEEKK